MQRLTVGRGCARWCRAVEEKEEEEGTLEPLAPAPRPGSARELFRRTSDVLVAEEAWTKTRGSGVADRV